MKKVTGFFMIFLFVLSMFFNTGNTNDNTAQDVHLSDLLTMNVANAEEEGLESIEDGDYIGQWFFEKGVEFGQWLGSFF